MTDSDATVVTEPGEPEGTTGLQIGETENATGHEVDDHDRDDTLDRVRIWFDNGASLAYWHKDEMTVEERVYSSDDPSSVWDSVEIGLSHGGRDDFVECVEQSLDVYVRDMGNMDDLEHGWTHLYEVLSR